VNSPTKKIAKSDIDLGPRRLTKVVTRRQDRWHPDADKYACFFAGVHPYPKPERYGEQEGQERGREDEQVGFCEQLIYLRFFG
jgi:hypothetical protein